MSAAGRRIIVVAGDPLPLPGLPTSGAGLRAWQLGQGLRACGHEVTFLQRAHGLERFPAADLSGVVLYQDATLRDQVLELQPDAVVFQHWSQVSELEHTAIPIALDMHGPVLLEISHHDRQRVAPLSYLKIRNIRRADFLSCAGIRQRAYFYAWMVLAGYDMPSAQCAVIPVALSPDVPTPHPDAEPTFVYGGVWLPWQDPSLGLTTLVETLEARGRGRLRLFAGAHPVQALRSPRLQALADRLAASARVERPGLVPHAEMIAAYLAATVAFDLMAPNPERELAFTTRTVEYLWCGLPVIYNDYAELAAYICEYNAGWTVDPRDPPAIRRAVEEVLDAPAIVAQRAQNAQRLIRERLNWTAAVAPLDAFCRNPTRWTATAGAERLGITEPDYTPYLHEIARRDTEIARLTSELARHTAEIERKNRHIGELERLLARIENGVLMRLLRRFRP